MVVFVITPHSAQARVLVLGRTVVARKVVESTVASSVAKTAVARKEESTVASFLAMVLEKTEKARTPKEEKVARQWT